MTKMAKKLLLPILVAVSITVGTLPTYAVETASPTPSASPAPLPKPTTPAPKPTAPPASPTPLPSQSGSAAPQVQTPKAPTLPGIVALQSGTSMLLAWTLPKTGAKKQTISISPSFNILPKPAPIDIKLRNYKFDNLVQGQTYTVTLKTITPNKKYTVQLTTPMPPNQAYNFRATRVSDNISLYWDRYQNEAGQTNPNPEITPTPAPNPDPSPAPSPTPIPYPAPSTTLSPTPDNSSNLFSPPSNIKITLSSPNTPPQIFNVRPTSTTYRITGVSRAVTYTIKIEFENIAGTSIPAEVEVLATTPSQPTTPQVKLITTSSVKITWDYQGPDIRTQSMKINSVGNKRNGEIIPLRSIPRDLTIDQLTVGGKYTFELVVTNKDGSSTPVLSDVITLLLPPTKPLALKATPADSSLILTWAPPEDNGGTAVTSYQVEYKPENTTDWLAPILVPGQLYTKTIPALTNSTKYNVRVKAITSFATSPASDEITAYPAAPPSTITGLTATAAASSVQLTWVLPAKDGGAPILNYLVSYKTASQASFTNFTPNPTALTATIGGLSDGVTYTFQVQAVNLAGNGPVSSITATPFTSPGTPTGLILVATSTKITATFLAPSTLGGLSLAYYLIQYKPSSSTTWIDLPSPSTALTRDITLLTNGQQYQVRVAAVTGSSVKFTGEYTQPAAATPATLPSEPLTPTATAGNLSANLSWTAPSSNGGATVTSYKVEYKASSSTIWTELPTRPTTTSVVITSLLSGTIYNFRVSAINSVGTSNPSATATATVSALPNAPASLTAAPATPAVSGQLKLNWTEPTASGVSPVTGYKVEYKLASTSTWTTATASILALSYTIESLTNGQLYDLQVSSINAIGTSLPRTTTATPTAPAP